MPRKVNVKKHPIRIVLSILFVLLVAFSVVRGCMPKSYQAPKSVRVLPVEKEKTPKVAKKKITLPASALQRRGKLAIILDDWGTSTTRLKSAIAINRPMTLAIIPRLAFSKKIAEEAKKHRLGVMLHLPMEAQNSAEPREPKTILTTTKDAEIRRYIDEALENVALAEGVNNHQGSKATSDPRVVRTALSHIHSKKLFFIDSYVSSKSVVPGIAKEIGIRFAKRDVFLDNESNVESIKTQLREAKRLALLRGQAIAIGHDRKNTLLAIKEVVEEFEKEGIEFVLAKDLVK